MTASVRRFVVTEDGVESDKAAKLRGHRAYKDTHNPIDPQDLKRHYQLLDRQHFGGRG